MTEEKAFDLIYPLGSYFIQYTFLKSPNELFKPTVWEKVAEDQGCFYGEE